MRAEEGIRSAQESRGLGNVYRRQAIILKKNQDVYSTLLAIEAEAKEKLKATCPLDLRFTLGDVMVAAKEAVSCKARPM